MPRVRPAATAQSAERRIDVAAASFGIYERNVLGTAAASIVVSILVLACLAALERRRLLPVPLVGGLTSAAAFVLAIIGIWAGIGRAGYWQTTACVLFVGLWGVLSSLLALVPLPPRHRWAPLAAVGLALTLTGLGIGAVAAETTSRDYGRVVGVFGVLVAAFAIGLPILSRAVSLRETPGRA